MLVIVDLPWHRTAHVILVKEAAIESAVWISIGLAFTGVIYALAVSGDGHQAAGEYLSGFLIEKSLSIDNVFVWAVIFSSSPCPASTSSGCCSGASSAPSCSGRSSSSPASVSISRFDWILYVFGVFLLWTAWKIAHHDETEQVDYERNIAMRLVKRVVPTTSHYDGQKLFTKENAKRVATSLFAVLVLIEATDVVFAVDSVPAILAVSRETFIVFSSNAPPSSACGRCTSCSAAWPASSGTSTSASASSSATSACALLAGPPVEWHPPTCCRCS